eukprot:tig00020537_g10280.t1
MERLAVGDVSVFVESAYKSFLSELGLAASAAAGARTPPDGAICRVVAAEYAPESIAHDTQQLAQQQQPLRAQCPTRLVRLQLQLVCVESNRSAADARESFDVLWPSGSTSPAAVPRFLVPRARFLGKQAPLVAGDAVRCVLGADRRIGTIVRRLEDAAAGAFNSVVVQWAGGEEEVVSPWEIVRSSERSPASGTPLLCCGCPGTLLEMRDRNYLQNSVFIASARLSKEQRRAAAADPLASDCEEEEELSVEAVAARIDANHYRSREHLLYEARLAFAAAVQAGGERAAARKSDPATDPFKAFCEAVETLGTTFSVRASQLCNCYTQQPARRTRAVRRQETAGPADQGSESSGSDYEGGSSGASVSEGSAAEEGGAMATAEAAPSAQRERSSRRPKKRRRTAGGSAAREAKPGAGREAEAEPGREPENGVFVGKLALQADVPSVEAAVAHAGAALRLAEGGHARLHLLPAAPSASISGAHPEPLALVRLGRPAKRVPRSSRQRRSSAPAPEADGGEEAGPDAAVWGALHRLARQSQLVLRLVLGEAMQLPNGEAAAEDPGVAAVQCEVWLTPAAFGVGSPERDEADYPLLRILLAALASQRARGHAHVGPVGATAGHAHHAHHPLANFDLYALYEAIRPARDAPEAEQPKGLRPQLYPFQRRALAWMLAQERAASEEDARRARAPAPHPLFEELPLPTPSASDGAGSSSSAPASPPALFRNIWTGRLARCMPPPPPPPRGGLLCDEMGLGKTVEMISLILANPRPRKTHGGTLIVVPGHIQTQWEHELQRHAPHLKVLVWNGMATATVREERRGRGQRRRRASHEEEEEQEGGSLTDAAHVARFDIVLTTYATLRKDIFYTPAGTTDRKTRYGLGGAKRLTPLVEVHWWRIVLDEAQQVGNFNAAAQMADSLTAVFRWGATGTPVSGSLRDLGGLLRLIRSDPFQNYVWWKHMVDGYEERTPAGVGRLVAFLRTVMWRHMKFHVEDEISLPACVREARVLKFSSIEFKRALTETQELVLSNVAAAPTSNKVAKKLMHLRQLCVHPQASKEGELLGTGGQPLTIDGIMKQMTKRGQLERDNAGRDLVRAHVSLACVLVERAEEVGVAEAWREAEEELAEALRVAEEATARRVAHLASKLDSMGPAADETLEGASRTAALAVLYEMSARYELALDFYQRALRAAARCVSASAASMAAALEAERGAEEERGRGREEERLTAEEIKAAIARSNTVKTIAVLQQALGKHGAVVSGLYAECDRIERRVLEERKGAEMVDKAARETKDYLAAQKYVHLAHRIEEQGFIVTGDRYALEELLISRLMTLRGWAAACVRDGLAERAQELQQEAERTQERVFELNPERKSKGAQFARSALRIPAQAAPWLLVCGAITRNLARLLTRPGAPEGHAAEAQELRERSAIVEEACGNEPVRLDTTTSAWLACAFGALRGLLEVHERKEAMQAADAIRERARIIREGGARRAGPVERVQGGDGGDRVLLDGPAEGEEERRRGAPGRCG